MAYMSLLARPLRTDELFIFLFFLQFKVFI
nr:MAG TPA: hypothetical protein [Caudoviricetes sp.]